LILPNYIEHAAPMDLPRRLGLLHEYNFRQLFVANTVSEVGSQISLLALPLLAVLALHASNLEVGVLAACGTAAFLLVGLPAGAWVDRIRRRNVLIVGDVGRALVLGSVPLAWALGVLSMPQLYLVALVTGAFTVFFDVAYQSYLPHLVGRERLVEGNAKLESVRSVSQIAGPSVAGFGAERLLAGNHPGGFRVWWRRLHEDSDELLDNNHLMRLAGRFARRVRAWAAADGVPVIDCKPGERKHRIAEEYLDSHAVVGPCVFLILVAKAPATVWDVRRNEGGVLVNIAKKRTYVNHYSFHIMDPQWGHLTIKMSGHPPFGAQVMLNGHEYVARQAQVAGIGFAKDGNCFTAVADPQILAQVADTLSQPATIGG
jgi:hypothetical protein